MNTRTHRKLCGFHRVLGAPGRAVQDTWNTFHKEGTHMFTKLTFGAVALVIALGVGPAAVRADDGGYELTTFDLPPDLGIIGVNASMELCYGNNRALMVVNWARVDDPSNPYANEHCAIVENGKWTVLEPPGFDFAYGSAPSDDGEVVLNVWKNDGVYFSSVAIYKQGRYTVLPNIPGDTGNFTIVGCNNRGQCSGFYDEGSGTSGAFFYDGNSFQLFDYPPGPPQVAITVLNGLNNKGQGVGAYLDVEYGIHMFRFERGKLTLLDDVPGAAGSIAYDINDAGVISGAYFTPDGILNGYVLRDGKYTDVIIPGAIWTQPESITANNHLVGRYLDSDGWFHGFTGAPKQKKK